MKKVLLVSGILALTLSSAAFACEKPQAKPEIPNPSTAVTAQMVKSNNDVRAYVQASEEYLNCARLSPAEARREQSELKAFADQFNQAIREFKARG
ncbi:MAG TPA: hypothetical protein VIC08_14265 [Cellvibrionaceae bacterium]